MPLYFSNRRTISNKSLRSLQPETLESRQLLAVDILANGDFSADLSQWVNESNHPAQVGVEHIDGNARAILSPTQDGTSRISQQIAVEGNTEYQLVGNIFSEGDVYAYLGVKGFDGRWSELTAGDNRTGEYSVNFTTAAETQFVTIYAQAYRQQTGSVSIDDLRLLQEGVTPETDPPVTDPPLPDLPANNLVSNGDFSQQIDCWVDESSLSASVSMMDVNGDPQLRLMPTSEGTASISQKVFVEANTDYRLSGQIFSDQGVYAYLGVKGFDGKWSEASVGDNVSGQYTLNFTTGDDAQFITLFAQAYKQQTGMVLIDDIHLISAELGPVTDPPVTDPPVTDPPVTDPPVTDPPVLEPDSSGNWVQGGDFDTMLHSAWSTSGTVTIVSDSDSESSLELIPTATESSRAIQMISGLKPQTLYTFATQIRTEGEGTWASFGVDQGTQLPKTNAAQGDAWQEKRFIFYTATDSSEVRLFLEAYQGQTGSVYFDDLRIVEGVLPLPSPPPGTEWPEPPALPTLVSAGDEMIGNADFSTGLEQWVSDHVVWQPADGNGTITLVATEDESARAVQDIPYALAPNTTYTLTATTSVEGTGATIAVRDRAGLNADAQLSTGPDQTVSISFTTGNTHRHVRVVLEQYKGSDGTLSVQDISMRAEGGEWLDTPQPDQAPTTDVLYDDFGDGLDPEKWLVVDKAWGGDNGGLVPENVELRDGRLLLHAHGDHYEGDVVGHNDRTTRVGAGIATRDYYASGRYEVHARIPEATGAASAFWTFHYIEHFPSEEAYWEEPSRVRNSEIDWEFPTALQNGSDHDPISFDNARVNSWGGKLGGEGAHHPGRVEVINDGQFHTYGIDWHSGGNGELPRVIWTIDGEEVYRHEGALFGQDNIPSQASRFWLGIWFPAAGYKEQIEGVYIDRVGWAGDPDFSEATLEIDWVRITPFNEANDRWEPETWPNGWYALPHEYPNTIHTEREASAEAGLWATDQALADWSIEDPFVS